jgi:methylated-DNA-[protein]-cysteine S-methyltransferase
MPVRFQLDRWSSPIGTILVVSDTEGMVRALDFEDYENRMHHLLRLRWGDYGLADGAAPTLAIRALKAYFEGDLGSLITVPIRAGGTAFQRDVWRALQAIPAGTTTSYGRLAANLGRPKASRAVGLANGSNPISIAVPCHRVIGSDGSLTGYGGGLARKQWLIKHEREWSAHGPDRGSGRVATDSVSTSSTGRIASAA